ncbi:MAG TPA: SDR family NAD(P)-dependent oxidoreductase [Acidimicrobiales bacterium]
MMRPALLSIEGAHCIVTGASRGIGRAMVINLASRGARVTGVARQSDALAEVADLTGARAFPADLADPSQVAGLIDRIEAEAGPVDVLVNNAGVALVDRLVDQPADGIRSSFAVNCVAPIELCRQAVEGMVARGTGRIANVSSLAAITAFPTLATYGATKAALVHFSAALQRELRRTPVRVTIVQLGEVAGTDMMEQARRSPTVAAVSRRLARTHALPKLTPDSVAAKVIDSVASGRSHVVVPARLGGLHLLRELPSRMNDALLAGIG